MKTPEQLLSDVINTFPKAIPAKEYLIKECLDRGINTPLRIAHFFAQVAHESGGFTYVQENLNYSEEGLKKIFPKYFKDGLAVKYARQPEAIANRVYADRMGNGDEASGDGWKYRGVGWLQLTGRENIRSASKARFGDGRLLLDPSWLSSPEGCAWSAVWFWNSRSLNTLADQDDVLGITKKINGGTNGLDDRKAKLNKLKSTLGIK